jgi:hypothetical protein
MHNEKRNFARLALSARASIRRENRVIEGQVENLSIRGAFIKAATRMNRNDRVAVTIYHTLTPQALCDLDATVVRVTEHGMGLQFEKSLLD